MIAEKEGRHIVRPVNPDGPLDPSLRYLIIEQMHEDEINLLDLWLVLVKRKVLFLSLVVIFLLLGVILAIIMPTKYNYKAAIEIGGVSGAKEGRLLHIEEPVQVLSKIDQIYIPLITNIFLNKKPVVEVVPEIKARLETDSNIVYVELNGVDKYENTYKELLKALIDLVKKDHERIASWYKKDFELSRMLVENEVIRLKDKEQLLISQNKRLDKKVILLKERIHEIRNQLKASDAMKQRVASDSTTEGDALALMMVDSELRASRSQLADLEDQLEIQLENSREVMNNDLTQNRQQQIEKREWLEKLQIQADFLETKELTEPIKSINPVGVNKKLIILIFSLAGFFVALFAVFFIDFIEKAKQYAASK